MSSVNRPEEGYSGTRLESFEEIREAVQASKRSPTVKEAAPRPEVVAYRPVRRPPLALVCILDDGRDDGEWVRVRSDRIVIGRVDGDIRIPHDDMMSGRHAELFRQLSGDRYRWNVRDLGSTNGTYARISATLIRHGQELLIGTRRFRFSTGAQAAQAEEAAAEPVRGTRGWQSVAPTDLVPSLVELTPQGEGQRIYLKKEEHFIGRDPAACDVLLSDDLMVSPRHARLFRDDKGRWHVENLASRNGVWLRIEKMAIESTAQLQLGEQRFLIKVL